MKTEEIIKPCTVSEIDFLRDIANQFNIQLGLRPPISAKSQNINYYKERITEALSLCMTATDFKKYLKNKK
ncbi:MAG: hypothetical protein WC827_03605 [Candidatus Paceibacterota bacterium]|jgi:hypothetical protein